LSRILVAASYHTESYYFNNENYGSLPPLVVKSLKEIAITFSAKIRGEVIIGFSDEGDVSITFRALPGEDLNFDEIGAKYHLGKMIETNTELFGALKVWYATVYQLEENI